MGPGYYLNNAIFFGIAFLLSLWLLIASKHTALTVLAVFMMVVTAALTWSDIRSYREALRQQREERQS